MLKDMVDRWRQAAAEDGLVAGAQKRRARRPPR